MALPVWNSAFETSHLQNPGSIIIWGNRETSQLHRSHGIYVDIVSNVRHPGGTDSKTFLSRVEVAGAISRGRGSSPPKNVSRAIRQLGLWKPELLDEEDPSLSFSLVWRTGAGESVAIARTEWLVGRVRDRIILILFNLDGIV